MRHLLMRELKWQPQGEVVDLRVVDGHIAEVGPQLPAGAAECEIAGHGAWLLPGLVDPLARLREPGATHKADIQSEARAALARGITWLGLAPDTQPPIDSRAVVELVQRRTLAAAAAGVRPHAALCRDGALAELATLQAAGCHAAADLGRPVQDSGLLRRALQYAASIDMPVLLQPLDATLAGDGVAHDGPVAQRLGLAGIPASAETVAVARIVLLAEESGARVLLGPLSSARSLPLLAQARERGVQVEGMVSTLQLTLNALDIYPFRSVLHLSPPLREEEDRVALLAAVESGLISVLCSDHQPHETDAKLAPFPETAAGAATLDAHLGLGLRLVQRGDLSLAKWIERSCVAARPWLGLPEVKFRPGEEADLVVIDPHRDLGIDQDSCLSAGRNSPFVGWRLPGRVLLAMRGHCHWLAPEWIR